MSLLLALPSCPGNPAGTWALSLASASCRGQGPSCRVELGCGEVASLLLLLKVKPVRPGPWSAGGPGSAVLLLWQGNQPACAVPPWRPVCLVVQPWGTGRKGCPCWSQFPVPQLGMRKHPGHHCHGAPGHCGVPEPLTWWAELGTCPVPVPPVPPATQGSPKAGLGVGVQGAGEA